MKRETCFLWLCLLFLLSACGPAAPVGPRIRVEEAWVRPSPLMEQAAAYMVIHNQGGTADTLTGAHSEAAGSVELHRSVMAGEVMRMEPVPRLEVPARGRVELQPGGLHFMVTDLKQNLTAGQKVRFILQFEKSGEMVVEAEVRMLEPAPPMPMPSPTGHSY